MTEMPTRGEKNQNPGNIDFDPAIHWVGQLGLERCPVDESYRCRFARFSDPIYGIRALAKLLVTYITRDGANTVRKIVERWAPPSDDNDTSAYVTAVAGTVGFDPGAILTPDAPTISALTRAIIVHENGRCIYDAPIIDRGVALALST